MGERLDIIFIPNRVK